MNRPPDTSASPAASIAMLAGLRPHTLSTPVPSSIRDVRVAISASSTPASYPQPSATWNAVKPSSSARSATRSTTSRRVSIGVTPTPTFIVFSFSGQYDLRGVGHGLRRGRRGASRSPEALAQFVRR